MKIEKLELTICSVCHNEESLKLLELNWEITKKFNPTNNFIWIIADNTPSGDLKSKVDANKFLVVPGVKISDLSKISGIFMPPASVAIGSYHHSVAINNSLKYVKTRFMLILDNDFYLVRSNWIKFVIEHMKEKELSFFGAPWHPMWWKKFRYFPAHFSLFIDLDKININTLDFRPQYDERSFQLMRTLKGRRLIGMSRDTSYAIYNRYYNDKNIKFECIVPVFKYNESKSILKVFIKKILTPFIPDKWSYIPKKKNYFTRKSFVDRGYFDICSIGWEEYIWRDQPFSFHLRSARLGVSKILNFKNKLVLIEKIVRSF